MAVARYYDHDRGEWVLLAAGRDGADGPSSWDDIADKPSVYPPESHTHTPASIGAAPADHLHTPASIGAAPANHTHSQYAESSRVTALEGSQPIIVSSLPASPLPGRIYLVTG